VVRRIGIVGHRALDCDTTAFVSAESSALLRAECSSHGDVVAISALAEGADTLFAESALQLGLPLEIVRPFDRYLDDFVTGTSRSRYRGLVEVARRETRLPFSVASVHAYETAMTWVVRACDVLVAAWDGSPPRGRGGTAEAIAYAERIGRRVVHLDVVAHRVVLRGGTA
jgi:hypothetical protein